MCEILLLNVMVPMQAPAMGVQQSMTCLLAVASASTAACGEHAGDRGLVVDGLRNAGNYM